MNDPCSSSTATQAASARAEGCPQPPTGWRGLLRRHWKMLAWMLVLLAWAAGTPGGIFMADMALVLTALGQAGTLLGSLVMRRRGWVGHVLVNLLLCALAFGAVRGITAWQERLARQRADALLAQVLEWRTQHGGAAQGAWPARRAIVDPASPSPIGTTRPYYRLGQEGQPVLYYRSAWSAYNIWVYDFDQNQWRFQPD